MYFWAGYTTSYVGMYPKKQSGILVLAGLAPCGQTVGSFLRTPWQQSWQEKFGKKWAGWIHFNRIIHSTTFHRMHLAKSKIWQSFANNNYMEWMENIGISFPLLVFAWTVVLFGSRFCSWFLPPNLKVIRAVSGHRKATKTLRTIKTTQGMSFWLSPDVKTIFTATIYGMVDNADKSVARIGILFGESVK